MKDFKRDEKFNTENARLLAKTRVEGEVIWHSHVC